MAGIGGSLNIQGVDRLNMALARFAGSGVQITSLLQTMGRIVEDQTRERIEQEQTSPDGDSWPAWSDDYAASRHSNHDLLQHDGHLFGSLQSTAGVGQVEIGTNLVYAASHQYGDSRRGIPQREFLGVNDENLNELQYALDRWADDLIAGAVR